MSDIQAMFERVFTMMRDCYWSNRPVLPRTMLFNEGWLLRLTIELFNGRGVDSSLPFSRPEQARWYSEALLPTHFKARMRTGDALAESRTHADAVVGTVSLAREGIRDLYVEPDAPDFVVYEGKLGSSLSPGTCNVPWYDQAARTVACMAEALSEPRCGTRPEGLRTLGFHVVAPREQLALGAIERRLEKEHIRAKVERRVKQYGDPDYETWFEGWFEPTLSAMNISAVSWEDVAVAIEHQDPEVGPSFREFYETCLIHNGMDESGRRGSRRVVQAPWRESSVLPNMADASVESRPSLVCGVDGCRGGWVAVWHDLERDELSWEVVPLLVDLLGRDPQPARIAVDVPIGLLAAGARDCDREARRLLGLPRSASVFPAPIRPVLVAQSHAEATDIRKLVEGKGMSIQAWGIVAKVREVDDALRADVLPRQLVREVHPELCFWKMNGCRPLRHAKKTSEGRAERVRLLRGEFGRVVDSALAARPSGCGADDLLDAFACAWTAARIANGEAEIIPAVPPRDEMGLAMEMVI